MFKVNEYFDGKVKSLAFASPAGPATMGVMAPGEYEFGTQTLEIMQVISGKLTVKLPGKKSWKSYGAGQDLRRPGQREIPAARSPRKAPTSACTNRRISYIPDSARPPEPGGPAPGTAPR